MIHAAETWDVQSDTWVATDHLGRTLSTFEQTGPPKPEKTVAMFYFLWNGRHGEQGPFDVTKILKQDPDAMQKKDSPLWGPMYVPHHWGESIFDYYVGEDEYVLRKHAQMLGDAGVDVVIFDVTNQLTYPESYRALCKVFSDVRAAGNHAPQIAFLTPFWAPNKVVHELWRDLYSKGDYADLWFRWNGKPLILADPNLVFDGLQSEEKKQPETLEILNFFTFRKPQPDYFQGPTGPNQWSWLEVYPQHGFYVQENDRQVIEQASVGIAQNAVDGKLGVLSNPRAHGRSFHDGKEPPPEECDYFGRNFEEQWKRVYELDPKAVFITSWNEWIMGRFDETAPFHGKDVVSFVDQFNHEFSRDAEPVKGGHEDAYYYQLIEHLRRFKGTRPLEKIGPKPIAVDGKFDDWSGVTPEFRDTIGDVAHRNERGWGAGTRYENTTGRNDIVAAKVSRDEKNVYFYVRTAQPLLGQNDGNWMLLFLDVDCGVNTGWLGYDFVFNRISGTLEKNVGGRYEWDSSTEISYKVGEREIELAIPRKMLGDPNAIHFKWCDNIQQTGEWSDFTLHGDSAPNDRYNYRAEF